jgi:choline-sulfatase
LRLLGLIAILQLATLHSAPAVQRSPAEHDRSATPVILISVDTLRADHLGCYGYRGVPTPQIDALAQGGTVFTQINSQVPLTLPSHTSLLTSTYPFANGVEDNGEHVPPGEVTLAGILRSRGYRTVAFIGGFVLDRRFGLDQGFDVYDSPFDLHRHPGEDPGDVKRDGKLVIHDAAAWLQKNSSHPFFLFLHLYDLHTPYALPAAVHERLHVSGYDAELSYVDMLLGQFWNTLARDGVYKRALIVFLSDHGESLGEHGEQTHGYFIYQSTLHVPLIFHWPQGRTFAARVTAPAGLIDVAPTILQFLGVPEPPQFQGRSLLGSLGSNAPAQDRPVYSESLYAHLHFGCAALMCLRVGRYKYIEAPRRELYDLDRDAGELHNLYASHRAVALTLRNRLLALRSRYAAKKPPRPNALSPQATDLLKSLGYLTLSQPHAASVESGPDPKDRIGEYREYGRAIELASAGNLSASDDMLKKILARAPDLVDVRNSLGTNEQKLGRQNDAIQDFRRILKADPSNAIVHFNLAVSLFELRKLPEAAREAKAALAIIPYYTRAGELLGTIDLQEQQYGEARSEFLHLLTVAPDDYTAHFNLGVLAAMQSKWDGAASQLKAALKTEPDSPEALNTLGSIYLRQGNLKQAEAEFAEAIKFSPKFAWAHYNLGLVFQHEGRVKEAEQQFRQALAADPKLEPARKALESMKP